MDIDIFGLQKLNTQSKRLPKKRKERNYEHEIIL